MKLSKMVTNRTHPCPQDDGKQETGVCKTKFSKHLHEALQSHLTVPYQHKIDISCFQPSLDLNDYIDEDINDDGDDEDRAIKKEALAVKEEMKDNFIEEIKSILGPSAKSVRVGQIVFEEMDDEDVTYKLMVSASKPDHVKMMRALYGMSKYDIEDVLSHASHGKRMSSLVEGFITHIIDRQHQILQEAFEADPESMDFNEPKKMSRKEAIGFINKCLDEQDEDIGATLSEFFKSVKLQKEDVIQAIKLINETT